MFVRRTTLLTVLLMSTGLLAVPAASGEARTSTWMTRPFRLSRR